MKYFIIVILLLCITSTSAKIVAEVGSYKITSRQLQEEMQNYEGEYKYSYSQIRNMALNDLINKQLLTIYAKENRITVDNVELETFFIKEVGDLPRFQTNGSFDYSKFGNFKKTSKGKKILQEMKKEILLNKTKTVIKNSFDISNDKLLKQFFSENTEIDLGYTIIDVEDANVPEDISFSKVDWYFEKNKPKYLIQKKVKLKLFVVLKEEFKEIVKPRVNPILKSIVNEDTTLSHYDIEKLENSILEEEIQKMAYNKAIQIIEMLENGEKINYPILETSYLGADDKLGELPSQILESAFEMRKRQFSEPIDFGEGYLVYFVVDKKKFKRKDTGNIANEIWRSFISKKKSKTNSKNYREYFETHIDKFIIPAAVITKIEFSKPKFFSTESKSEYQDRIKKLIIENFHNENALRYIIEDFNLKGSTKIIYLDKFSNEDIIDGLLVLRINQGEDYGFLTTANSVIFYKVNSFFPEYIPRFKRIKSQLHRIIEVSKVDTSDYRTYYDSHKKDFKTADSLQLGYVVFPIAKTLKGLSVTLSDSEIHQKYQKNIDAFYREKSVKFNYIYTKNLELAEKVKDQAESDLDFSLLKLCFGQGHSLPQNTIVETNELPDVIKKTLSRLSDNSFSKPVQYDNGWFVLYKIRSYSTGVIPYNEIKYKLRQEEILSITDSIAYNKARTVFDSTSYFSQLHKFVDENQIFKTEFQDAKCEFDKLGSLDEYRKDLMRMWRNEKYTSIIKTDEGYAVIFLLKKRSAKQLSFEEALPEIEEIFTAKKRFESAKEFISKLRNKIAKGCDPDSLLFYLGGWKQANDLTLNSKIPGVDFSKIILEDILKREESYCSPVFPISQNQLLFYYIYRLKRPTQNEFYAQKNKFKQKIINRKYNKWLQQYKVQVGVKIKY